MVKKIGDKKIIPKPDETISKNLFMKMLTALFILGDTSTTGKSAYFSVDIFFTTTSNNSEASRTFTSSDLHVSRISSNLS